MAEAGRPVTGARYWLHGVEAGCVAVGRAGGPVLAGERAAAASKALRAWFDRHGGGHCDAWAVFLPEDGNGALGYDLTARLPGTADGHGARLAASLLPTYRHEAWGVGVALWGDARRPPPDIRLGRSLPRDPARLALLYVHARLVAVGLLPLVGAMP